jgi:antitoxin component of MazEF toxin-antitoxin module
VATSRENLDDGCENTTPEDLEREVEVGNTTPEDLEREVEVGRSKEEVGTAVQIDVEQRR